MAGRKWLTLFMAVLLVITLPVCAFASKNSGSGSGDGSGGGGGENQLTLSESSVSDGQKDVPLDTELKFVFSNNVVNLTVKENNATCFSMTDESGAEIPIQVVMADDQLEQDLKEIIVIEPEEGLQADKTYTLVISKELQSKNGSLLGDDITITFSTAAKNGDSTETVTDTTKTDTAGSGSTVIIVVIIALLVIGLVVFMVRRRGKKD